MGFSLQHKDPTFFFSHGMVESLTKGCRYNENEKYEIHVQVLSCHGLIYSGSTGPKKRTDVIFVHMIFAIL